PSASWTASSATRPPEHAAAAQADPAPAFVDLRPGLTRRQSRLTRPDPAAVPAVPADPAPAFVDLRPGLTRRRSRPDPVAARLTGLTRRRPRLTRRRPRPDPVAAPADRPDPA